MNRLFIGRHGQTDRHRELGAEGKFDARLMARQLEAAGFAQGIILSSTAPWVADTARIVREESGAALYRSPYIRSAGEHPEPIGNLYACVERFMGACAITHGESDVMIVTHAPLVDAVAAGQAAYGRAYPVAEAWVNPRYMPDFAFLLEAGKPW